jgi:chromosome partitioning protein
VTDLIKIKNKHMKNIITFCNHKGGVGKTTTTVNIGAALAKMNKRVLLFDLDPQCNLTQSLGINNPSANLYDLLENKSNFQPICVTNNLYVIPASVDLAGLELKLSNEPGREYVLKELIYSIKENFDFILIDCPPSLGLLTLNALTAASKTIIVLQAEFLAMHGLSRILDIIEKVKNRINPELILEGVVITQYNSRKVLNKDIVNTVESHLKDKVFNTYIRENISLAEAPSAGLDIFRYNQNSNGAEDYMKLAKEFLNRLK